MGRLGAQADAGRHQLGGLVAGSPIARLQKVAMAARRTIRHAVKLEIVRRLAAFDSAVSVALKIRDEFGVDVTRQAIEKYDPTARAGRNLSKSLREEFDRARKAAIADVDGIAIAHRAVRLRQLQRLALKAEAAGDIGQATACLRQAAMEVGDAFTNTRKIGNSEDKPFRVRTLAEFYCDAETERRTLEERTKRLVGSGPLS